MKLLLLLVLQAGWAGPLGDEADRRSEVNKGMVELVRPTPSEPVPSEPGSVAMLDETGFLGISVSGGGELSGLPLRDAAISDRRYGMAAHYYTLAAPVRHESGAVLHDPGAVGMAAVAKLNGGIVQAAFLLEGNDATKMVQWLTTRYGEPELSTEPRMGIWRSPSAELTLMVLPGTQVSLVQFVTSPGLAAFGGDE